MKRLGVIGAGKVGTSLAHYFSSYLVPVGFYSRRRASSEAAVAIAGGQVFDSPRALVAAADFILVTTPDDVLEQCGAMIGAGDWQGKIFAHASGSKSSNVFFDLKEQGATVCSLHPVLAIDGARTSSATLAKAFFTLEGDEAGVLFLLDLFQHLGNPYKVLQGMDKTRYHLAIALLSNGVIALGALAETLLTGEGFSPEEAEAALRPLAEANLKHLFEKGPCQALTGPVERGDIGTVQRHLAAIQPTEQALYDAYLALAKVQAMLAKARHPARDEAFWQVVWEGAEREKECN